MIKSTGLINLPEFINVDRFAGILMQFLGQGENIRGPEGGTADHQQIDVRMFVRFLPGVGAEQDGILRMVFSKKRDDDRSQLIQCQQHIIQAFFDALFFINICICNCIQGSWYKIVFFHIFYEI